MSEGLFDTVTTGDALGLFDDGQPDAKKIVGLLDLKKEEVATAANVSKKSVRYDERMPKELRDRLIEWATALQLVADHFDGDVHKTVLWFRTPNHLLGGITPRDMIRFGRFKKLLKFIQEARAQHTEHH